MMPDYALLETLVTGLIVALAAGWVCRRSWNAVRGVLQARAAGGSKACSSCSDCGGCDTGK
ncbi:MAG: hypothetical protein ACOY33_05370 [Pseudomonadota bacterium]